MDVDVVTDGTAEDATYLKLLVWMVVAHGGKLDSEILSQAGLKKKQLTSLVTAGEPQLTEMRHLFLVGKLANRKTLGLLLRARIAEMALNSEKPSEIRDLTTAFARLPDWAFDEPAAGQNDPQPAAHEDILDLDAVSSSADGMPVAELDFESTMIETRKLLLELEKDFPDDADLP